MIVNDTLATRGQARRAERRSGLLPAGERRMIRVQPDPFDAAAELAALAARAPTAGAIASFVGLVRPASGDAIVDQLELDHHGQFTQATVAAIADDARRRFALLDLTVIHRFGSLDRRRGDRVRRRRRRAPPRRVRRGRLSDGPAQDRGAVLEARAWPRRVALDRTDA